MNVSYALQHPSVIDATRLSDGETVILKRVLRTRDPFEKDITIFLSSEPAKSHPRNHSVVLHEVFDVPGTDILLLVMPVLTQFDEPSFETVGEVLECFRQVFEVRGTIVPAMTPNDLCRLSRDWSSSMTAVSPIGRSVDANCSDQ